MMLRAVTGGHHSSTFYSRKNLVKSFPDEHGHMIFRRQQNARIHLWNTPNIS